VRPFRRADRDRLTALVNAHARAVVPGAVAPVNTVLGQLEAEPDAFIVDPWVDRRATLVAGHRGRVVAAAHLLRYRADGDVEESYRDIGEICWLLLWPPPRSLGCRAAAPGGCTPTGCCRLSVSTSCPNSGRTCTPSCAAPASPPGDAPRSSGSPTFPPCVARPHG